MCLKVPYNILMKDLSSKVKNVRRVLTLPETLNNLADRQALKKGLPSVQAYIQYLIVRDTEDIVDEVEEIEELTAEEINAVGQSLHEYANGEYGVLRSPSDIAEFVKKASESASQ